MNRFLLILIVAHFLYDFFALYYGVKLRPVKPPPPPPENRVEERSRSNEA